MTKHYLSFLLLLSTQLTYSQPFSAEQTREDLKVLLEGLKTYEAALYHYNPDFDRQADSILQDIPESVSVTEHFGLVSRLAALAHEGHFSMGGWDDVAHTGFINGNFKYLPMSLRVLDGHLYVWTDASTEGSLSRGDEILAINGRTAAHILAHMYRHLPADGRIVTYRERTLEGAFNWMYYLFVEQPESFEIRCRRMADAAEQTIAIRAIGRTEMFDNVQKRSANSDKAAESPKGEQEVYELTTEGNTAVLTLRSFNRGLLEQYKIKSGALYKSVFNRLASEKTGALIVDLRDNIGGRNEFADDMLPYIIPASQKPGEVYKTTRSWKGDVKEYTTPKRNKRAYGGKIYVLVNGRTYSAGATLARYLKEYAGAVVIGEETGTRYEGFVAGSEQSILLPHSGIRIGVPRYHIEFPKSEKQQTRDRGLLPDYRVSYTIQDLMEKRDLEMQLARKLIGK
ncbi:MAG: hypothetical protein H6575_19865 [Lewinellaceae bacterium]|nr:hypothetical protein [Lewinellaceae bacterium]